MNPKRATRAPAARLSQRDWRPDALTSSALLDGALTVAAVALSVRIRLGNPVWDAVTAPERLPVGLELHRRVEPLERGVDPLARAGFDTTGIDLDALIGVSQWLEGVLGRTLPGQVYRAGAFAPVSG